MEEREGPVSKLLLRHEVLLVRSTTSYLMGDCWKRRNKRHRVGTPRIW